MLVRVNIGLTVRRESGIRADFTIVPSCASAAKDHQALGGPEMTSPSTAKRISPMLAVADMEETILFYQGVLGFSPTIKSPDYSNPGARRPNHPPAESGIRGRDEVRPWAYRDLRGG
jgi:hypothetical protein